MLEKKWGFRVWYLTTRINRFLKKTRILKHSLFLLIGFVLFSCIEDITDDYPFEEKPVITAILENDQPIYLEISSNYQQYLPLKGFYPGIISVFENGTLLKRIDDFDNKILLEAKAKQGNIYSFSFNAYDFKDSIYAKTNLGNLFTLKKPIFLKVIQKHDDESPLINLTINDPETDDYYEVTCKVFFKENRNGFWRKSSLTSVVNPNSKSSKDSLFDESRYLLSDSGWANHEINLNLRTSLLLNKENKEWFTDTFMYVFTVRNISYSYYQYQRTKYLHTQNQGGDFFTGSSSATTVYSNIRGGLGIFGGYYEIKDSVIVVKP